jgi:tetratricopeptide (TPR) repeat protein
LECAASESFLMLHHTHMSVIIPEPRLFRIRALQRAYSALQKDLPYLEERIYLLRAVVSDLAIQHRSPRRSTHVDVSSLARHRYDLGTALYDRYLHILELVDLEEAEACLRLTLRDDSLTLSFPNPSCLLGSVLREYAHRSKDTRLTEEALSLHRKPFESHAYPHISVLEHAHRSRELGLTLLSYEYIKFEEDILSESIRHLQAAQAAFTDMQVPDHTSCIGLSIALVYLCYIQLDRTRMDNGVKYGTLAIALCGSAHRDFYRATQALGSARSFFFFSFDDLESLNCAIDLYQAALGSDPPPRWAQLLIFGLTQNLNGRSIRLGRTDDLLEAITHITALLAMLGPEDERWASLQESLALSFHTKFKFTGMQEDIEAAARAANSAYCAAGPGTEVVDEKAYRLSVIASCRGEQYAAFGDIAHLNECVELLEHVMEMAVVHSSHWMYAAANLLEAYHLRYKATEDVRDLDRAIALLPPLKKTTQDRATNAPNELFRAGDAFLSRFLVTGTLDDLEQATMLHQEAAAYDSAHHNHETRNAYATTLRTRYEVLHEEESAAKALEMQKKAIAALSEMHPDRPSLECGLARIRLCVDPTPTHVSEAFDHVLGALNSDYCPAYKRLKSVLEVLAYLSTHMPILGCENALKLSVVYSTSIDLLPQVASFGLEPRARLAVMTGAGQFTIQGAVHAISIGQLDQALEMLEAGRSVFWTQGLRLRTPFTDLPRVIGDRLTKITYALSRPPLEGSDKDHELSRRRKLGNEFQAVLAEARLEPGFEDLLKNVSFEALARAASHHPVLVLVAGDASGHAIIVSENAQCMLVGLPRATNKALRALATRVEARIKTVRSLRGIRRVQATDAQPHDVYKQLWTLVMRPIVEALRWPVREVELLDPS